MPRKGRSPLAAGMFHEGPQKTARIQRLNTMIMKTIISLLIGCSLALAGAALAQQPVEQQSPSKGKRAPGKTHASEAQPRANAPRPQERPANQTGETKHRSVTNEHGATNEPGSQKGRTTRPGREAPNA